MCVLCAAVFPGVYRRPAEQLQLGMETSTTSLSSWYQFSVEDQSEAAVETAPTTSTLNTAGQKPFDFGLLFRCALLVIGIIGILANGLVLGVLATSKQLKKERFNVLFVNQMSFDLYSSVMIVIVTFMKIFPVRLIGTSGHWLCVLFYGETVLWLGLNGSMLNMAAITVERYVKIVFPVWHKNRFHPWMVYCTVVFSWATAAVINVAVSFPTSAVVKGTCRSWSFWPSDAVMTTYAVLYFIFYFFNLVVISDEALLYLAMGGV